jgi:hypothetical protein
MSKLLNDKDFFMCTGGLAPAQMQTIQRVSKKKDGTLYLLKTDTATSSIIDFSCKKMMILMAIIAVVVCALVIATGGMALIAAAAIGGAIGAVAGALICGQKGAAARKWIGYKKDFKILGTETLTDSAYMKCMLFQEEIRIAPHIKNWWQAAAVGLVNFTGEMFKCVMVGAAAAGVAVLATEGIAAFFANAASNYLITWTTGWGLGLRGAMGLMDGVNQKYVNGASTEDAINSGLGNAAFGMEKGTANSAYNVATGQGTFEDYTGLLGWGAPIPRGNGEAKGPGPEADHMGSNPWEGKPQSGKTGFKESPRMSRSEVQAYKKAMNEQGINVEIDKSGKLPENTRAAFDNQTGTVYLRKGATQYEAFHEAQHAQQWKEMGKEAYNKQSRVQKEQYVYDQVMKNKDKFSQAELDHARDYMNDVRKAAGMEPMPLDKMETKGQDGDLFEDPAVVKINSDEVFTNGVKSEDILNTPKGSRPDPSTYLSPDYIANHLSEFKEGASYLVTKAALDKYGRDDVVGRGDGQFVMTKAQMDKVLTESGGDISIIEKELGIPENMWKDKEISRIDVVDPESLNLRMPSGNESGANELWLPGGKLPTGYSEAVVDAIPKGEYVETVLKLKE